MNDKKKQLKDCKLESRDKKKTKKINKTIE